MTLKDIPAVHRLLQDHLRQFHLAPVMSMEEVQHWLLPQENIIDTYLVEVGHLHSPQNILITKISEEICKEALSMLEEEFFLPA